MTRWQPVIYRDWRGGRNDSAHLLALRDNELAEIENFYVARDAHLKKRAGYDTVYDTSFQSSAVAHGLQQVRIGTTRYLITTYGTAIHKDNTGAITGTASLTAGQDKPVVMTVFQGLLIGTQSDTTVGINAPFAWNGSGNAAALTTSPPSLAVALATFKNRVVMGNVTFGGTAYPESVVWSKVGTSTTWPTNQLNGVYPGTGKYITKHLNFFTGSSDSDGELLLIFKDTGLFYMRHVVSSGAGGLSTSFAFGMIDKENGCPSPHGAIVVDRIAYWASYNGFYMMGPDLIPIFIGGPLSELWKKVPKNRVPHIKVEYLKDLSQLWFSVSVASTAGGSQSSNNRILVFDTQFKRWVGVYTNISANAMAEFVDSSNNRWLYTGDYANYLIYKQNFGNDDDGTGIQGRIKSGFYDLGNKSSVKSLRAVLLLLASETDKQGSIYITLFNVNRRQSVTVSIESMGAILDNFELDFDTLGGEDYSQAWERIGGDARYAQIEIVTPKNSTPMDIYGYGFFHVLKRTTPGTTL
jgi:hypothetical protein